MFKGKTLSVVMPAYNEEEAISQTVSDFLAVGFVDEVVVVDNNSKDQTAKLAQQSGARVVLETEQGYGHACQRALREASTDLVVLIEPDGTFLPRDITKFLAYADDFDVIFGSRTSKSCILAGSNMGYFLRYGNWAVAKLLEYLHNGPCLTDVGCTYKMFRREVIKDVERLWSVGGSAFSPESMITSIRRGWKCVEIPVNYGQRVGTSKITGKFSRAFKLGLGMVWLILVYRFKPIGRHTGRSP